MSVTDDMSAHQLRAHLSVLRGFLKECSAHDLVTRANLESHVRYVEERLQRWKTRRKKNES